MKKVFNIVALLAGLGLPGIGSTQGVNVGMPIGSSCPAGYHWEMGGGFAQCVVDAPPVPPIPPVASYTFIYLVGFSTVMCNGNGCHTSNQIQKTTTSTGNQWTTIWQQTDNPVLPWGFDIGPLAASNPITTNPQDLRTFMAPFVNANCVLASDSDEVKSIISNATGLNLFSFPGAGLPFAGQTMPNSNVGNPAAMNFALCQTAVM